MSYDSTFLDNNDSIDIAAVKSLLTPGRCVSPHELKSFLVMSRKHSDYSAHTGIPRAGSCNDYITSTIFPAWLSRDYVLDYCGFIADQAAEKKLNPLDTQNQSEKSNPIDPRLDPYGNRDYGSKPSSLENSIRSWVDYERSIEDIIRQDTTKFLLRKCGPSFLSMHSNSTRLAANPSSCNNNVYEAFKKANMKLYNED